jgi:hypothetical protein
VVNSFGDGSIDIVMVTEKERGNGIAYAMLQELFVVGESIGVENFTLEVRVSNAPAIHIYEKLGFVSAGIRPRFYEKPVEDELFGYMISVSPMGMTVRRAAYGARSRTEFIPVAAWNGQAEGELILRVQGSRMEILLPDSAEPVFTLNDATPYSHGLCGLYSNGKEFAVTELSVRPVKE